jgi:Competence protein CoiA-like family
MARAPQRIIEAAIVERIGPITAQQLLTLTDDSWGVIRDRITDRRNGKDGLIAKCMACESPVYIRTSKLRGIARPLFQHYSGSEPTCPWYQGRNINPDAARAAQYQGRQESTFHRLMCEEIASLVALDARYIKHAVEAYLPPTDNAYGRFPDVYVEWEKFGSFAVEFQMSGTFQTEISARCKHYEREGIPLIWILFGINTAVDLPQSMVDVIRRHRGNAFVLDQAAVAASHEQKTLVLSCYLRNADGALGLPQLVRLDALTIPRSKLPYFEDRIVGPRLAEIEKLRRPWFKALTPWEADRYKELRNLGRPQSVLLAAAFSIVATANGKEHNYASEHQNITAMLNTYLSTKFFSPYTDLLTLLIETTAVGGSLKPSVGEHLSRYRANIQADEKSPEWQLLRDLLPEALDPVLREELIYLDALPHWAIPAPTKDADLS